HMALAREPAQERPDAKLVGQRGEAGNDGLWRERAEELKPMACDRLGGTRYGVGITLDPPRLDALAQRLLLGENLSCPGHRATLERKASPVTPCRHRQPRSDSFKGTALLPG
ncbi:MAG TPA: hypothetical protein VJ740_03645, partial [Hyphomicrobiaceae bacterium]|nr:hypothetical protein [Hyphomicrobiaceae bacterium]